MKIGLRIDVDTLRGTQFGVPRLCRALASRSLVATFFFSVGPDNMGRHLWRLARPAFFWKMIRSNAPALYGWDILLRGTAWRGPIIGHRLAGVIRQASADGHEIGLHAWDHHAWQARLERWDEGEIREQIGKGMALLSEVLGTIPTCSAAPAWRCDERTLVAKQGFPFTYNSDCRGSTVFLPTVGPERTPTGPPQVPVTLPTYDEWVGREGRTGREYYRRVRELLDPEGLNVLAIHAEVEGMSQLTEFEEFLDATRAEGWGHAPLGELIPPEGDRPPGRLVRGAVAGREGWVAVQAPRE